jgi:hypothetical protein
MERSKARTKEAIAGCEQLRTLLSEWLNGIHDAARAAPTREATLNQLEAFMRGHNFEPRLKDVKAKLGEEQRACDSLISWAELFHSAALEEKGALRTILQYDSIGSYELYQSEGMQHLEDAYKKLSAEIDRTSKFLRAKQGRIIPWFGSQEPAPAANA